MLTKYRHSGRKNRIRPSSHLDHSSSTSMRAWHSSRSKILRHASCELSLEFPHVLAYLNEWKMQVDRYHAAGNVLVFWFLLRTCFHDRRHAGKICPTWLLSLCKKSQFGVESQEEVRVRGRPTIRIAATDFMLHAELRAEIHDTC